MKRRARLVRRNATRPTRPLHLGVSGDEVTAAWAALADAFRPRPVVVEDQHGRTVPLAQALDDRNRA